MNNRQERVTVAARSAVGWVRDLEKAPKRVTQAAERLREALDAASATRAKQRHAKDSRRAPRYSISEAKTILLKKHLHPIAADGLVMFAGFPGIEETLKIPRIKDAPDAHLKAAERVRRVAEEHEEEYINGRDYSDNFLEQFDKAVRDLESAARVDKGSARAKYTRATDDMKDQIAAVRRAFDALDTRMVEAYMGDRLILETWRKVSRVKAKTGRPRKKKPRD
jgi:hypothetical protein